MGPAEAPAAQTPPSVHGYCSEGYVLDLPAETLQYVTRATLDILKCMLTWKPLPQPLVCWVKVSIWRRGFFFSA